MRAAFALLAALAICASGYLAAAGVAVAQTRLEDGALPSVCKTLKKAEVAAEMRVPASAITSLTGYSEGIPPLPSFGRFRGSSTRCTWFAANGRSVDLTLLAFAAATDARRYFDHSVAPFCVAKNRIRFATAACGSYGSLVALKERFLVDPIVGPINLPGLKRLVTKLFARPLPGRHG